MKKYINKIINYAFLLERVLSIIILMNFMVFYLNYATSVFSNLYSNLYIKWVWFFKDHQLYGEIHAIGNTITGDSADIYISNEKIGIANVREQEWAIKYPFMFGNISIEDNLATYPTKYIHTKKPIERKSGDHFFIYNCYTNILEIYQNKNEYEKAASDRGVNPNIFPRDGIAALFYLKGRTGWIDVRDYAPVCRFVPR